MNAHELESPTKEMHVLGPVAIGANATKTGKIIDRQGWGGVRFIMGYGAVTTTGSVVTAQVKEGDVTGTLTSVADADLVGTETLASLLAQTPRTSGIGQNVRKSIGYKGTKRYVQVNVIQTGTTSVGCVDVAAMLFNPESTSGIS
jgi:hypothetical protein